MAHFKQFIAGKLNINFTAIDKSAFTIIQQLAQIQNTDNKHV